MYKQHTLTIIFIKLYVKIDVFQNLLLRKRKTQEDEISNHFI